MCSNVRCHPIMCEYTFGFHDALDRLKIINNYKMAGFISTNHRTRDICKILKSAKGESDG